MANGRKPRRHFTCQSQRGIAELHIVGDGPRTYLWIGNTDRGYNSHLSGEKTLRLFALSILAALDKELPG